MLDKGQAKLFKSRTSRDVSRISPPRATKNKQLVYIYYYYLFAGLMFQEINGTFKIVPQSPGRMPPHSTPAHRPQGQ